MSNVVDNSSTKLKLMSGNVGNRRLVVNSRSFLVFIFVSYSVVLSPFLSPEYRNYLVLFSGFLGGLLFLNPGLKVQREALAGLLLISVMALQALFLGGGRDLLSVGLTLVYALGYFAVAALFDRVPDKREFLQKLASYLIFGFAIMSVIQMVASFTPLPVPNLIASKGMWSYNSFAFEPSQLGRVIGITMLAYLILMREPLRLERILQFPKIQLQVVAAFLITMLLSGSALAASAIVAVFVMSRSLLWTAVLAALVSVFWPIVLLIDFEPLNRTAKLLSSLGSLDIQAMLAADSSGASRLIPAVIYLKESAPSEIGFWIGYGGDGLSRFFLHRIPGFGDTVPAGFVPGFTVVYGVIGTLLFLWVFVFRLLNRTTAPLIVFLLLFFSTSAWNIQVFWYGLMLVRMTWAAASGDRDCQV